MAETRPYRKPLPRVDEESRGYWEALARHELYFQRCRDCGTARFYPRAVCPSCLSSATEWVRASGRGTVYTFTVTQQNQSPGFREELPYVLAMVELAEGPRPVPNPAEVETDYGHVLVYGVNRDIVDRFDFTDVRLPAQELVTEVARLGGLALPCHPGRPTVGLCDHYARRPPLDGVVAVEALNGGSKKGEDARVQELIRRFGYRAYGGSDSHLVSFVGVCATEVEAPIPATDQLVPELGGGRYRPVDFRSRRDTP